MRFAIDRRSVLVMVLGFGALPGCDQKKETSSAAASASAAASVAPPPAPAPIETAAASAEIAPPKKKEPKVCPPTKVVDFGGNALLEAQVRLKTSKPKGDISVAELSKVKSLNLSQGKIDELDACIFPHFTGLKELFLGPGKLEDLGPIEGLKNLESLRASLNQVADLSPLAKLTKMDRLDLGHTRATDLRPLSGMEALTELQLDDTPVSDLKPLAELKKLERLSVQRTSVKDLTPLKGLTSLKFLYVSGAPIDDKFVLSPLMGHGLKIVDQ